jgi:hypothetical protein
MTLATDLLATTRTTTSTATKKCVSMARPVPAKVTIAALPHLPRSPLRERRHIIRGTEEAHHALSQMNHALMRVVEVGGIRHALVITNLAGVRDLAIIIILLAPIALTPLSILRST